MSNINLLAAFTAGLLSFLSPCVLPLVPSYLAYVTGMSFNELSDNKAKTKIVLHSLFFIFGFSLIFILLGASISFVGQFFYDLKEIIRIIGGTLIFCFGFMLMINFKIPFLQKEHRFQWQNRPAGYFGSFLVGITFAAAWTPCVGPILGSILVLAGAHSTADQGVLLLTAYSTGLAVPFLLTSLLFDAALLYFKKISKYLGLINFISGLLLVIIGLLLLTNYFQLLVAILS